MSVLRRALNTLALFLAGMAAVLFLSAWSLRFIEAWIYLALFGILSAAITVYLAIHDAALLERRLKAGPGAEPETSQKIIQLVTATMMLAMLIVAGFDHRFGWSVMPTAVVAAGDGIFALSFVAIFIVFRENTFTSGVIEVASGQSVVSTGPYAIVRHPLYAAGVIFLLATALALGSWWALIPATIMGVAMIVRLLNEERFLARNLAGYSCYCARVRWRLVPGVW